jgi:4-amino-4-deoxy-L-arabinose transferase-like glycosyltransferase
MIWDKIRKAEPWRPNDRLIIFVLLTAGMLIKGPVVWAFLLPGILAFRLWRDKTGTSAFPGTWPWVASLIIFVCWVAGGIRYVPRFYEQVVQREFLGRFGGELHRAQPLLFYTPHLLHKFAPWSLLIIALAVVELRAINWKWRSVRISPATGWLICWSIGGLVFMSLLPSKRVDRIFPVIPPLCLLLASQISARLSESHSRERFYRWSAAAIGFALVFAGAYVGWKVSSGYHEHRDALAQFGRHVREEAAVHNWQYAVMNGPDEGLLLYLRLPRFVRQDGAVSDWNSGRIGALVVPDSAKSDLLPLLPGAVVSSVRSNENSDDLTGYRLLTR